MSAYEGRQFKTMMPTYVDHACPESGPFSSADPSTPGVAGGAAVASVVLARAGTSPVVLAPGHALEVRN
jgi:hypothetical protein